MWPCGPPCALNPLSPSAALYGACARWYVGSAAAGACRGRPLTHPQDNVGLALQAHRLGVGAGARKHAGTHRVPLGGRGGADVRGEAQALGVQARRRQKAVRPGVAMGPRCAMHVWFCTKLCFDTARTPGGPRSALWSLGLGVQPAVRRPLEGGWPPPRFYINESATPACSDEENAPPSSGLDRLALFLPCLSWLRTYNVKEWLAVSLWRHCLYGAGGKQRLSGEAAAPQRASIGRGAPRRAPRRRAARGGRLYRPGNRGLHPDGPQSLAGSGVQFRGYISRSTCYNVIIARPRRRSGTSSPACRWAP
jgi:hypothetical protein